MSVVSQHHRFKPAWGGAGGVLLPKENRSERCGGGGNAPPQTCRSGTALGVHALARTHAPFYASAKVRRASSSGLRFELNRKLLLNSAFARLSRAPLGRVFVGATDARATCLRRREVSGRARVSSSSSCPTPPQRVQL